MYQEAGSCNTQDITENDRWLGLSGQGPCETSLQVTLFSFCKRAVSCSSIPDLVPHQQYYQYGVSAEVFHHSPAC